MSEREKREREKREKRMGADCSTQGWLHSLFGPTGFVSDGNGNNDDNHKKKRALTQQKCTLKEMTLRPLTQKKEDLHKNNKECCGVILVTFRPRIEAPTYHARGCVGKMSPQQNVPGKMSPAKCPRQNVPGRMSPAKCPRQNVPGRMSPRKCLL